MLQERKRWQCFSNTYNTRFLNHNLSLHQFLALDNSTGVIIGDTYCWIGIPYSPLWQGDRWALPCSVFQERHKWLQNAFLSKATRNHGAFCFISHLFGCSSPLTEHFLQGWTGVHLWHLLCSFSICNTYNVFQLMEIVRLSPFGQGSI